MAATATATLPIGRFAGAEAGLPADFCETDGVAALVGDGGGADILLEWVGVGVLAAAFLTVVLVVAGLVATLAGADFLVGADFLAGADFFAAGAAFLAGAFATCAVGLLAADFLTGFPTGPFLAVVFFAAVVLAGAAFFTTDFFAAFPVAGFWAAAFLAAGLTVFLLFLMAFFADFFTATSAFPFIPL